MGRTRRAQCAAGRALLERRERQSTRMDWGCWVVELPTESRESSLYFSFARPLRAFPSNPPRKNVVVTHRCALDRTLGCILPMNTLTQNRCPRALIRWLLACAALPVNPSPPANPVS